ncbi:dipeptidase [Gemmatimonadota bacterium]
MSRFSFLRFLAVLLPLSLPACGGGETEQAAPPSEEDVLAQAAAIHEAAITIDTHDDIPGNYGTAEVDPCAGSGMKVDIPKMVAGGLDMVFPAVYVGQGERTPEGYEAAKEAALNKFAAIHRVAEEMCPDRVEIAYTAADVERIHAAGKRIFGIGIENGYAIGQDLSLVGRFYELGARYITLTHNGHNDIGDSTNPSSRLGDQEEEFGGLSPFGEEVVREMNRLGIMIDVSHVSRKTMMDVVNLSAAPIIASHSGAGALADVSRNLNDEQLLALKDNGGVIQVVALGGFLQEDPPEKTAAMEALREELGFTDRAAMRSMTDEQRAAYRARMEELDAQWPAADVSTMVDHIDYVVSLIGIDHVGIGTDFDGGGGIPGFNDASEALNLTVELVRRGYTEEEIGKIWGGNTLRVWREVEEVAARMQSGT